MTTDKGNKQGDECREKPYRGPSARPEQIAAYLSPFLEGVKLYGRYWQVFGLVDDVLKKSSLLTVASRAFLSKHSAFPLRETVVVSTYRCGTVPELHRIPCRLSFQTDCHASHEAYQQLL
jgi:hypothetical protein